MDILFTFAISDYTGASRMGLNYVRALRDAGHRVVCVCQRPPAEGASVVPHLQALGVDVRHLGNFHAVVNPALVLRLVHLIRREGLQVAISMNQGDVKTTGWAAYLAGIPYVPQIQNLRNFGPGLGGKLKEALYGLTMRVCTHVAVASSGATEAEALGRFGMARAQVVGVPNAIDPSALPVPDAAARAAKRAELGLANENFAFSCVGRLGEQKGQVFLLQAWPAVVATYPRAHLFLVGDAGADNPGELAYAAKLRQIVADNKLEASVHFLGWRNDVGQIQLAVDGYVHPAMWEGFPLAVLEAFGAGLPTVMSDCVGRPKGFIDDVHGYLVPKGTVAPLAEAMLRLMHKTTTERAAMGEGVQQLLLAHYDLRQKVRDFVAVVEAAARG